MRNEMKRITISAIVMILGLEQCLVLDERIRQCEWKEDGNIIVD